MTKSRGSSANRYLPGQKEKLHVGESPPPKIKAKKTGNRGVKNGGEGGKVLALRAGKINRSLKVSLGGISAASIKRGVKITLA